ncbi:ATP-binding protein [Haloarchaeobius sp. DYHT-AS-18]|uniref:ATP-binding protein n=1 Tax=Haloarchaeobius sp. DYHT-AS-18 TaxID=3446117 RepID=UPI003EBFF0BA
MRGLLRRHPCLPVVGIGTGYLLVAVWHVWSNPGSAVPTAVEAALLVFLAGGILYGSYRLSRLDLTAADGLRVFTWVVGSGLVGFVVGGILIEMQQLEGVALENVPILLVTSSGATAIVGLGVTEYRERLLAEKETLRSQTAAIARLHRRLTVLNRVLRHNLRNESTIIRGYAELLLEDGPDQASRDTLATIVSHADNIERLSTQAKRLNCVWEEDATVVRDLTAVVPKSVDSVRADHDETDITTDLPESAHARVHPRFEFAITEAVENAVRHNEQATSVHVSLTRDGPSTVTVTVADTGDGIPSDELAVLREGSEDSLFHGSGLGLWLVYWTVTQSDGALAFDDNDPQGTVVEMAVPATDAARR